MQFVRNHNVNSAPYREVFWPVTVTFLLLLISIVALVDIFSRSSLNDVAPFVQGVVGFMQALTATNSWLKLAIFLITAIIVLGVFFSVYDRGDGFWATLGKTLFFFIIVAILTGTIYNAIPSIQVLQVFGPNGSTGAIIGVILFSLVLAFIPARLYSKEQRPLEQPGYAFVGCASVILTVGLLVTLISAIIHFSVIPSLVVNSIIMPLVATARSFMPGWLILSPILSIILLVIATMRVVFASVRGKALLEGDGSGPALRRTLVVLTIEAILITMLYRAAPLLPILMRWGIQGPEILNILLNVTTLLLMNAYAFAHIRKPEKGSSDFWASVAIFLLFLVIDAVSLGMIYGVIHGFVWLVHSWSGALPYLVAAASVLANIVITVDKDDYLIYLFRSALILLGIAYLLGAAFVVFAPGLLGLTYFAGSWWIALLIASPALITVVISLLRPSKP